MQVGRSGGINKVNGGDVVVSESELLWIWWPIKTLQYIWCFPNEVRRSMTEIAWWPQEDRNLITILFLCKSRQRSSWCYQISSWAEQSRLSFHTRLQWGHWIVLQGRSPQFKAKDGSGRVDVWATTQVTNLTSINAVHTLYSLHA